MNPALKPPPAIRILRVGLDSVCCRAPATAALTPAADDFRKSRLSMRPMLLQPGCVLASVADAMTSNARYEDDATFYRSALLLGLVKGADVVAWSDSVIARDRDVPPPFVEIAATDPDDLTALREAIYPLCDAREAAS